MNLTLLHSDNRGQIYTITGDGLSYPEIAMFTTNEGFARGGCIHEESDEYTCVISGSVKYQIGIDSVILKLGESTVIPKNTPHYFVSLTDSVVLEWGAKPEEKKAKHRRFRQRVDKINDNQHTP